MYGKLETDMKKTLVTLMNAETGEVSTGIPLKWLGTILSTKVYAVVEDGTKPYAKKTYKPSTPKKFAEDHPEKVVVVETDTPASTEEKD